MLLDAFLDVAGVRDGLATGIHTADEMFRFIGTDRTDPQSAWFEYFRSGLEAFESTLGGFIDGLRATSFNSTDAPRLILVSPIGHEDLGGDMLTGEPLEVRNETIRAYVDVMDRVAGSKGVPFVDLFAPSAALYRAGTLTSNGIHPNELGCFWFAKLIGEQLGWLGATAAATPRRPAASRSS